jgi:hypothetical protein
MRRLSNLIGVEPNLVVQESDLDRVRVAFLSLRRGKTPSPLVFAGRSFH